MITIIIIVKNRCLNQLPANSLANNANKPKYRAESPTWSIKADDEPKYNYALLFQRQMDNSQKDKI